MAKVDDYGKVIMNEVEGISGEKYDKTLISPYPICKQDDLNKKIGKTYNDVYMEETKRENTDYIYESQPKVLVDDDGYTGLANKKHKFDAGQDIMSNECVDIAPKNSVLVKTGVRINVPEHYVAFIKSRSGLSCKHQIEVGAGVIDHGYNGEIIVHLYNNSFEPYTVNKGDKIAQLITMPIVVCEYIPVDSLNDSERGENGFGSTGK